MNNFMKHIWCFGLIILALNACKKDDTEPMFKVSCTVKNAIDKGGKDGSITLTVTGKTEPYTFNWSNGATTKDIDSLSAGTYTYTVTDKINRTVAASVSIIEVYSIVQINTEYGEFHIWLHNETPLHRSNFISLTKDGFYDSLIFHRVIDDFVIQGGDPTGTGTGGPGYTIQAEFVDSIMHDYGAVGAARTNNPEKRSSGSQFYIVENSAGAHHLDGNYTVFGMVINGMNVVAAIAEVETDVNDRPLNPVYMTNVEIVYYSAEALIKKFGFQVP